jgi:hypothetical protein
MYTAKTEVYTAPYISRLVLPFLSVGPAGFALHFPSVGPFVEGLNCTLFPISRPWKLFLSVDPSVEALYCTFISRPLRGRFCTALSISRPLREGFVLHFCCTFRNRPFRGGFVLHFLSVGPSAKDRSSYQWSCRLS